MDKGFDAEIKIEDDDMEVCIIESEGNKKDLEKEKLFCVVCNCEKSGKKDLKFHLAFDHFDCLPYECPYCETATKRPTKFSVYQHINFKHPGKKLAVSYVDKTKELDDDKKLVKRKLEQSISVSQKSQKRTNSDRGGTRAKRLTVTVQPQDYSKSKACSSQNNVSASSTVFSGNSTAAQIVEAETKNEANAVSAHITKVEILEAAPLEESTPPPSASGTSRNPANTAAASQMVQRQNSGSTPVSSHSFKSSSLLPAPRGCGETSNDRCSNTPTSDQSKKHTPNPYTVPKQTPRPRQKRIPPQSLAAQKRRKIGPLEMTKFWRTPQAYEIFNLWVAGVHKNNRRPAERFKELFHEYKLQQNPEGDSEITEDMDLESMIVKIKTRCNQWKDVLINQTKMGLCKESWQKLRTSGTSPRSGGLYNDNGLLIEKGSYYEYCCPDFPEKAIAKFVITHIPPDGLAEFDRNYILMDKHCVPDLVVLPQRLVVGRLVEKLVTRTTENTLVEVHFWPGLSCKLNVLGVRDSAVFPLPICNLVEPGTRRLPKKFVRRGWMWFKNRRRRREREDKKKKKKCPQHPSRSSANSYYVSDTSDDEGDAVSSDNSESPILAKYKYSMDGSVARRDKDLDRGGQPSCSYDLRPQR